MALTTVLEVKRGNIWTKVEAGDVAETPERHGRCTKCKKPVTAHKRGKNGAAAHPEHRQENTKCPFSRAFGH